MTDSNHTSLLLCLPLLPSCPAPQQCRRQRRSLLRLLWHRRRRQSPRLRRPLPSQRPVLAVNFVHQIASQLDHVSAVVFVFTAAAWFSRTSAVTLISQAEQLRCGKQRRKKEHGSKDGREKKKKKKCFFEKRDTGVFCRAVFVALIVYLSAPTWFLCLSGHWPYSCASSFGPSSNVDKLFVDLFLWTLCFVIPLMSFSGTSASLSPERYLYLNHKVRRL